MKRLSVALCAGVFALTGFVANAESQGIKIDSKKDLQLIVGKKLWFKKNQWFVIHADGTFKGIWNDKPLEGTYQMRRGAWCRKIVLLDEAVHVPGEDCQLLVLVGDKLHGKRDRGRGNSFTYNVSDN